MSVIGAGELFQLLRDGKPRTRAELVSETGLARTPIVVRIAALHEVGLVEPVGVAESSGGRPASRFAFNPRSRVVVSIDLGATHGSVGISDLSGQVLASKRCDLKIADGPVKILNQTLESAFKLINEVGATRAQILGVGVGVPGPVEHSTGRPIRPPIMPGWDGFDIPGYICSKINVPVLVDNDVNLLALGERERMWPDVDDLLFIKISTGIGAGVISGGVLQRGAQGSAGDIGHVQVPHGIGEQDLEETASGSALARELEANAGSELTPAQVTELIRTGDEAAISAAREAGRAIGEVAAICVSMLNPSTLVIGGQLGINVQEIIAGIREVVYKRSIPLATQHLNIVAARGGKDAGIRGAALMVIEDRLSAASINAMLAN